MRKDQARDTKKIIGILPASYTATETGDAIDMRDNLSLGVEFDVFIGAVTTADASNTFEIKILQSETIGGTYVAADSAQYDVLESWDRLIDDTGESDSIKTFNFRMKTGYPFIKVEATVVGTVEAIFAVQVVARPQTLPAQT